MTDDTFKSNASYWTYSDLYKIGISYNSDETGLPEFMLMLGLSDTAYPPEHNLIVDGITKLWTFSFDFDLRKLDNASDKQENIDRAYEDIKRVFRILKKQQKKHDVMPATEMERKKIQVFHRWNVYLTDFMKYFRELLMRLESGKDMQGEERFTHLFMLFARIVFLSPEPGHTFKLSYDIKKDTVSGYPDARFIAHESQKTIAVIEAKKETDFKVGKFEGPPFIWKYVPKPLLGQHAIELLLENADSHFDNGVVGIICIGTKVVFTFLQIEKKQCEYLTKYGTGTNRGRGKIYYTKHFDFMKTEDRNEIVIPLLMFANLQSKTDHGS